MTRARIGSEGAFSAWLWRSGDARPAALFRIGWSLAMVVACAVEASRYAVYADARYHEPLHGWFLPLEKSDFRWLVVVMLLASVSALVGFCTRTAVGIVTLGHAYLFASDLLSFRNHIYLALLLGALLALCPSGHALSIDQLFRDRRGQARSHAHDLFAAQLVKGQISVVYLWSVLNKLHAGFLDGWTFQQELPFVLCDGLLARFYCDAHGQVGPWLARALGTDEAMAAAACGVVCAEAFLCVGLWMKPLRRWAVALGVLLHGSIFLCMNVFTFGLLMVASYPLFLADMRRTTASTPGEHPAQTECASARLRESR